MVANGMSIEGSCTDTLTAAAKVYIRMIYKCRGSVIADIEAIGAGITLTEESHKQIA